MKPNLLQFANNAILSKTGRESFNLFTGQTTPDDGFMIQIHQEPYKAVDKDLIRELWYRNMKLFVTDEYYMTIEELGGEWLYSIEKWVPLRVMATVGRSKVWDCTAGHQL